MDYILSPEQKTQFVTEFRQKLENVTNLPVLPEVAQKLLALRNNPNAGVENLVEVISVDPVISAHILRYARMSIFGFGNKIKSLQDAITLPLGYEKALYMALGLSAGHSLKITCLPPLGGKAFWGNALNTAMLTQALAKQMPKDRKPAIGLCYLSGLLHEIGLLLLAHLYPNEFSLLNKVVAKFSQRDLRELEFKCLGISHDLSGVTLLRAWDLPSEIIVAVGEYDFPDYGGKHAIYPKLVYLAKQLLKQPHNNIKNISRIHSRVNMGELGLDEEAILSALSSISDSSTEIDEMVEGLVA